MVVLPIIASILMTTLSTKLALSAERSMLKAVLAPTCLPSLALTSLFFRPVGSVFSANSILVSWLVIGVRPALSAVPTWTSVVIFLPYTSFDFYREQLTNSGKGIRVGGGSGSSRVSKSSVIEDHLHLHWKLCAIESVLGPHSVSRSPVEVNMAQRITRNEDLQNSKNT